MMAEGIQESLKRLRSKVKENIKYRENMFPLLDFFNTFLAQLLDDQINCNIRRR